MNPILNADLHCHSNVSDGTLSPEAVAARASANGVELWALTDHDELGGQARAAAAAKAHGMRYLTGTEISVTFIGQTVHIVGLGFDPLNADLVEGLRQTRGGREQRARDMAFTRHVFGEKHASRIERHLSSPVDFDFPSAAELNDVLPPWRGVPVVHAGNRALKPKAGGLKDL